MSKKLTLQIIVVISIWLIGMTAFVASLLSKSEWDSHIDALARKTEADWHLPHGIAHAFCLQENSGQLSSAVPRHEKGYFNIGGKHREEVLATSRMFCDAFPEYCLPVYTEALQESTSWGPFQLMGVNLRAMGCTKRYLPEITVEEHFYYWGKFFAGYLKRFKTLERAVKMYNGPSAPASYSQHVLAYRKKFSY